MKAAGFTDDQSEVLVEIIERAHQPGFERFAEVLERSLTEFRGEVTARFDGLADRLELTRAELRAEL